MASKSNKAIPGFTALGGSARKYRNDKTGETISKRQYQKLQTEKELGVKVSNEKAALIRAEKAKREHIKRPTIGKQHRFNELVTDFKRSEQARILKETGKKVKLDSIRVRGDNESAKEFTRLIKRLKNLSKQKRLDKSPTGELAQILTRLGRRNPEWDMPVGQSPGVESGG